MQHDATMRTSDTDCVVSGKLLNGQQLLDALFDPGSRPSIRWLRTQVKARTIPTIRIGHLCFFDLEMVRASLAGKNLVRHRMTGRSAQMA
jgi:hypothetical protein